MNSKSVMVAGFWLSFGLLCCVPGRGFGQNAISTGTNSGFRMYRAGTDWWLDPSAGRFDIRANGGVTPLLSVTAGGLVGINRGAGTGALLDLQQLSAGGNLVFARNATGQLIHNWIGNAAGDGAYEIVNHVNTVGVHLDSNASSYLLGGSVGIGTTSPASKLEINGGSVGANALMLRNSGLYTSLIGKGNASADSNAADVSSVLSLGTLGGNSLVTQGNIGVGSSNPPTLLYALGAAGSPSLSSNSGGIFTVASGDGTQIQFGGDISNNLWLQTKSIANVGTAYNLLLNPLGGNVGIGTASPSAALNVRSSVGSSVIVADSANSQPALFIGNIVQPDGATKMAAVTLSYDSNTSNKGIININSNGTAAISLSAYSPTYFNSGSVGIGTTNPASVFSVGAGSPFQVSSSGNIAAISGVPYTWPASNASGVLTNTGTGTLSWAPAAAAGPAQTATPNGATTTTFSGLAADTTYRVDYALTWGGSGGNPIIRFNGDTGNNYSYNNLSNYNQGSTISGGLNTNSGIETVYNHNPVTVGDMILGYFIFRSVNGSPAKVRATLADSYFSINAGGGGGLINLTGGGTYNGSASLTSVTLDASAGTYTGTITLTKVQ